jgi:hypothetical protein
MNEQLPTRGHAADDLKMHLSDVTRHVRNLAVLESRLLVSDWNQARPKLLCALGCWGAATLIFVAALPVAAAALGLWLAEATILSTAAALSCVVGGLAILAAACVVFGWIQFRRQLTFWEGSRKELLEDVRAVRAAISKVASDTG